MFEKAIHIGRVSAHPQPLSHDTSYKYRNCLINKSFSTHYMVQCGTLKRIARSPPIIHPDGQWGEFWDPGIFQSKHNNWDPGKRTTIIYSFNYWNYTARWHAYIWENELTTDIEGVFQITYQNRVQYKMHCKSLWNNFCISYSFKCFKVYTFFFCFSKIHVFCYVQ